MRLFAAIALLVIAVSAEAKTLRYASQFDPGTMDPHALSSVYNNRVLAQVYEPLVGRDEYFKTEPRLALSWTPLPNGAGWRFKLRPNVKFHDGSPFNADDVVFNVTRALHPLSAHKTTLPNVTGAKKVDDLTVDVLTSQPTPVLPLAMSNLRLMSKAWAVKNHCEKPQDYNAKEEMFSTRNANGTGPYVLVAREQDVRTQLRRNEDYWGKGEFPLGVSEITYLTIKSDATRIAALLSGEVDFVQDVPVQDIDRLEKTPGIKVNFGPENRTIFLGLDVASPELKSSNIKGKNPFADKQVRQALNMAIDREAIKRVVMRGQSIPAGVIAPPFVNGYPKELDRLPKVDLAQAKALLQQAGFADGFQVTLNCPNDRYVNDEGICQAVTAMLAKIGVKVNLVAQPKGPHFTLIQKNPPETEFYLLGWGVPTYDSHYIFSFLYHTRSGREGGWNGTRYSNSALDSKIENLAAEIDVVKRNAAIADIWKALSEETIYLALHHQQLAYAMKSELDIPVSPDNQVHMKFIAAK